MHRALGLPTQVRCMKGLGSPFSAALRPGPWGFIICFVPSVLGPEPRVQAGLSLEGGGRGWGGDRMSLSCHTHPCPRPRKREGQKAWRESETKTGERRRDTGESRPEWGTECGHPERQTDRQTATIVGRAWGQE